jgi:hypothetical protein
MKMALGIYVGLGCAWWAVNQFVYVNGGYPYWQGLGTVSDPNQVFGGILCSFETIFLWPYAAVRTTQMGSAAGD